MTKFNRLPARRRAPVRRRYTTNTARLYNPRQYSGRNGRFVGPVRRNVLSRRIPRSIEARRRNPVYPSFIRRSRRFRSSRTKRY